MNQKKVEVRYYTRTGNTKKLADQIAGSIGCGAHTLDFPLPEKTDILFLGASIYGANIDKNIKDYIHSLDPAKIGKVVVFSTSALVERAFPEIKKHLVARGISVASDDFYCRGQFTLLHRGRPNSQDLIDANKFAVKILKEN